MKRHCSVCHLPGHDRRAHHRRRNPDTAQLGAQFSKELEKAADYTARGKKRGAARAERSAGIVSGYLDAEKPVPHDFYTIRGKFGQLIRVPIRYDLMSADAYRSSVDDTGRHLAASRRQTARDQRRAEAEEASRRHEASHKRKLSYDSAHAKAERERRKREIVVSPNASRKVYEAAVARAAKEGKSLVVRARRGGGNEAQRAYFSRRTGN